MLDLATAVLLVVGAGFMLLAGVGVNRMPDLYMRTQAATKAATLGVGCMLMAVALHFGELTVVTRAVLIAAFILLTAPVSGHMIARAAHSVGTPLWEGTIADELRGESRSAGSAAEALSRATGSTPAKPPDESTPPC